ncbi:MAG: hypothetical protein PT955_05705 [Bacteroidales bacterium]|nr:hypothetical protein [Bacteroidales bacterium]
MNNVGSRLGATYQAMVLSTQAMVADRAMGHHHRVEDTMMIGASETRRSW